MQMGEVLGSVGCAEKDDSLNGINLKIVRLYDKGKAGKVIVAGAANLAPENGDFVMLVSRNDASIAFRQDIMPVDYAIMGFIDEYLPPYGAKKN